jgi:hypothetical protein
MICKYKKKGNLIVLSALTILFSACSSVNRNVNVRLTKSLEGKSIQVEMIGVTGKEADQLDKADSNTYWNLQNSGYNYTKYTMPLLYGKTNTAILPISNSIWKAWYNKDAEYLYIITDMPDLANNRDVKWKLKMKMEYYSWFNFWSNKNLNVLIKNNEIKKIEKNRSS